TAGGALLLGNDDLYQELGYVGLSRGRAANHLYVVGAEPDDQERGTALQADAEPSEELRHALAVSHAQRLATDLRDRGLSLRELFAEGERLAVLLASAGPDPTPDVRALTDAAEA